MMGFGRGRGERIHQINKCYLMRPSINQTLRPRNFELVSPVAVVHPLSIKKHLNYLAAWTTALWPSRPPRLDCGGLIRYNPQRLAT